MTMTTASKSNNLSVGIDHLHKTIFQQSLVRTRCEHDQLFDNADSSRSADVIDHYGRGGADARNGGDDDGDDSYYGLFLTVSTTIVPEEGAAWLLPCSRRGWTAAAASS